MSKPPSEPTGRWTRALVAGVVLITAALILWFGPTGFGPANPPKIVVLYCFSTLDEVMQDRLLPAFREYWQREQNEAVEFVVTFAGSGDITDRILTKYPAEIAIVSSELDAQRLPVPWRSWQQLPNNGVLARSPLVIVVRDGNPQNIRGFEDLGREGLEVVRGHPKTSGAAELAILAEYHSVLQRGGDSELAFRQLRGIWKNAPALLPTSREARNLFASGRGDALVTYEHDVLASPTRAQIAGEIVYPVGTLVAEPIVVKIQKNISDSRLVDAFVEFLWTQEAQRLLTEHGFRSIHEELNAARGDLATLEEPLTLSELGAALPPREILDRVLKDRAAPKPSR